MNTRYRAPLAVLLLVLGRGASAQNLQRFSPAPTQEGGFIVQGTSTPGHLRLSTGVVVSHARDPLVTVDAQGALVERLVSDMTTIDALVAMGLGDRFLTFDAARSLTEEACSLTPCGLDCALRVAQR